MYMEGERHQAFRLVRGIKNRYGPTDEVRLRQGSDTDWRAFCLLINAMQYLCTWMHCLDLQISPDQTLLDRHQTSRQLCYTMISPGCIERSQPRQGISCAELQSCL